MFLRNLKRDKSQSYVTNGVVKSDLILSNRKLSPAKTNEVKITNINPKAYDGLSEKDVK